MIKELEALERLYCAGRLDLDYVLNGKQNQDYKIIETALKALEIIKRKEVNVFVLLHSGNLKIYNDMVEDNRKLTQEKYDLLKEVLLWD